MYIGQHANAFTQANDLAWNPQTLFRCQCTAKLFLLTGKKPERNAPAIPIAEAMGFTVQTR